MPSNWFKHDSNARNSKKIIRLRSKYGPAGYGIYFMLVERLREEEDFTSERDYAMLAFDLRADEEMIRSVVEDFALFEISEDGRRFTCHGLHERMEDNTKKSDAGKKGASARWNKNPDRMAQNGEIMATAFSANGKNMATASFANGNIDKIREDKKREDIDPSYSSSKSSSFSSLEEKQQQEGFISETEMNGSAVLEKEEEWRLEILREFLRRNYRNPEKEYERFIAFNNTGGRSWEKMDATQRESALVLWSSKDSGKRFSEDLHGIILAIVNNLWMYCDDSSLLAESVGDDIDIKVQGQFLIIFCSIALSEFLERNLNLFAEIYNQAIKKMKVKNIRYATPTPKTNPVPAGGAAQEQAEHPQV